MVILYWDSTIRKGNIPSKLAKLAPAPSATKIAGRAQHIRVEVEANSEKKLAALSCMLGRHQLNGRGVEAVVQYVFFNQLAVDLCIGHIGEQHLT